MALWPFIAGSGPAVSALVLSPPLTEPTESDLAVFAAADDREPGSPLAEFTIIAECTTGDGRREILAATERATSVQ